MNLQIEPEKIKQLIADLEAEANEDKLANYKPYLKQVDFHLLDTGHFALEDHAEEISGLIREFAVRQGL